MRAASFTGDGRWLAVGLLLAYYALIGAAGPTETLVARWQQVGVYALTPPFADLQIFPAARATLASGGELYGISPTDPLRRSYNYPRIWLSFMRYPASDRWIRGLGCALAALAIASVVWFWGRLSIGEGLLGGLLLCSPAFQLGVERGSTDLLILVLLIAGILVAGDGKGGRLAAALWWLAAVLKLFPVLALGGTFDGSLRPWLRRTWLPLVLFAAYLALTWRDLLPVLRNTGAGWAQSYGSEVLALSAARMKFHYGTDWTGGFPVDGVGRLVALAGVGAILFRRWWRPAPPRAMIPGRGHEQRALLGFRIGTLIFLGTFIAGVSFDYRQCFLLLTLPQLFAWCGDGGWLPRVALAGLLFSLGANFLLAGWPGFFLNEAGGWMLAFSLAALLAETWRPAAPVAA